MDRIEQVAPTELTSNSIILIVTGDSYGACDKFCLNEIDYSS